MGLDLNKLKKRKEDLESRGKGGKYWKPKEGKNTIRVFSFEHKVTGEEAKAGLFPKDQVGKTVTEMDRVVIRHFGVDSKNRPVFSTPELVQKWKKLLSADKEAAREIRPAKAFFMNVVDTENLEGGMVLYGAGTTVYDGILNYIIDPEYGDDLLGCTGRDFVINYDPNAKGAAMYQIGLRKEGKSEKLPSDLEDSVLDLYSDEVYAQMGTVYEEEKSTEKDEDDGEEEINKKGKPDPDDVFSGEKEEDDEDNEDEEDDEDKEEFMEEGEDEEDEDEDEKPAKLPKSVVKKKKKK